MFGLQLKRGDPELFNTLSNDIRADVLRFPFFVIRVDGGKKYLHTSADQRHSKVCPTNTATFQGKDLRSTFFNKNTLIVQESVLDGAVCIKIAPILPINSKGRV